MNEKLKITELINKIDKEYFSYFQEGDNCDERHYDRIEFIVNAFIKQIENEIDAFLVKEFYSNHRISNSVKNIFKKYY